MADLRKEDGFVVAVLHFHHGIRGAEADSDQAFVAELAAAHGMECVIGRGGVPAYAKSSGQSLATAARELRYQFFDSVLRSKSVDKIATAHTMDDQAETVLMRLLRGAGTRGLAGIHPEKKGDFIRPMLGVRRGEVEEYLQSLQQTWREDATNADEKHFRNQVRHSLIPMLRKDFNPNVVEVLARIADIAQGEEEYWANEIARLLPMVRLPGKPTRGGGRTFSVTEPTTAFNVEAIFKQPVAVQRRLLMQATRDLGIEADSEHIEQLVSIIAGRTKTLSLPGGWSASKTFRELQLQPQKPHALEGRYSHVLAVPGEATLPEMNLLVQARLEPVRAEDAGYNSGQVQDQQEILLGPELAQSLIIRNWQVGDRFWPAQSKSEKKVKDILQQLKVPAAERSFWPVVTAGDRLIWVRGSRQRPVRTALHDREFRVIIEARELA
ncbi:MAG TPA: tRNA lysidine(34) synthetase TilS [Terriglobales bacterium]|nr:tRNA lysidine(34) synthetase TilS [Terriglobales bacterium]